MPVKHKVNCVPKYMKDNLLKKIEDGSFNPEEVALLSPKKRRALLGKIIGLENAKWVNAEFESKMLLKNQQKGFVSWANKIGGLTPARRRDFISRVERMEQVFDPDSDTPFLDDIVERRMGMKVTESEAADILALTKELQKHKLGEKGYGKPYVKLQEYIESISPPMSGKELSLEATKISAKGIKASMDYSSAFFRQGWTEVFTFEGVEALLNAPKYVFKERLRELKESMYEGDFAQEAIDNRDPLGLTLLGVKFDESEEDSSRKFLDQLPTMIKNKALQNAVKLGITPLVASQRIFEGFVNNLRLLRFRKLMRDQVKRNPGKAKDPNIQKDIAKVVSAGVGRGSTDLPFDSKVLKNLSSGLTHAVFSPKWFLSRLQVYMNPLTKLDMSKEAWKKTLSPKGALTLGKHGIRTTASDAATMSLARGLGIHFAGIAAINALLGIEGEDDPRKPGFGKVTVGNTEFGDAGGMLPFIVLANKLSSDKYWDRRKGKFRKSTGNDRGRLIMNFLANKRSPAIGLLWDFIKGKKRYGASATEQLMNEYIRGKNARDKIDSETEWDEHLIHIFDTFFTPIIASTTLEGGMGNEEDQLQMGIAAFIADNIGISTTTFDRDKNKGGRKSLSNKEKLAAFEEKLKKSKK